ncbi:hypothetical protein F4805DRAFT_462970 [Annulohypoxylon moriforme]|nr:hypothetical protein F4805DRAFT_462970 [Annulohypoxylon moriforme]
MTLTEKEVTEFIEHDVKPFTIIVLLTNCQGEWRDTGFGTALKKSFPTAYGHYQAICTRNKDPDGHPLDVLKGTCYIIPPIDVDHIGRSVPAVYIACIFSSFGDGHHHPFGSKPGPSPEEVVKDQTTNGFKEMRQQLNARGAEEAKRLAEANDIDGAQKMPGWTETGKNMKICLHKDNGKDFHLEWEEVKTAFEIHFEPWDGQLLFVEKHSPPPPPPSPVRTPPRSSGYTSIRNESMSYPSHYGHSSTSHTSHSSSSHHH